MPLLVSDSGREPVAALLRVGDDLLSRHAGVYGDDPSTRSVALAEALASSVAWSRLRGTMALAVRPDTGLVGILGSVGAKERALVDGLGWHVDDLLRRLRPVSYLSVEQACLDVAEQIRSQVTDAELAGCRVVAIPRGGLIVAGILAYALGLSPASLGEDPSESGVTILVDDCAISGVRLREHLARARGGSVIVALLHAHPELRRQLMASEPNVRACVVGDALADHAPRRHDYEEWRRRWSERSPGAYWIGDPDHVVYPWNEPDALIWNDATAAAESGWRVAPPSWCLKNRAMSHDDDVQRCEPTPGSVMPSDDAIWATSGGLTLLAGRHDRSAVTLNGSAQAMWQAVVRTGSAAESAELVARDYGAAVARVRADLDSFIAQLAARGLLDRR